MNIKSSIYFFKQLNREIKINSEELEKTNSILVIELSFILHM